MKKYCTFLLLLLLAVVFQTAAAQTLTLPSGTKRIEDSAFQLDYSLNQVVLPEGIEYIGWEAFANTSVTKVNLPDSLWYIAYNAFDESPTQFTYNPGTYAEWWVGVHNADFHFDDPDAYDYMTVRTAFYDDCYEWGCVFHQDWVRNYVIEDYDTVRQSKSGTPEWSVRINGDSHGAYFEMYDAEWAGDGNRGIDLIIKNEPDYECAISYTVTCTWDGTTVEAYGWLEYYDFAIPNWWNAPDIVDWKIGQETEIRVSVDPPEFYVGDYWNVELVEAEGNFLDVVDQYKDGNDYVLKIKPTKTGTYSSVLILSDNTSNVSFSKWVNIIIRDKNGNLPDVPEIDLQLSPAVPMYIFEDNDSIGLMHSPWVTDCYIEWQNWNLLKYLYPDDSPSWWVASGNVELENYDYQNQWNRSVLVTDPPSSPKTESYSIGCEFISGPINYIGGSITWKNIDGLPTGMNVPETLNLKVGENKLNWAFEPANAVRGATRHYAEIYIQDLVQGEDYDFYNEDHTLFININANLTGTYYGYIYIESNNVAMGKEITVEITK